MVANVGILDYPSLIHIVQPYAGNYANDPQFMQIVATAAKAESGWNVNSEQIPGSNGGGKGLWQFDFSGGMGTQLIRSGVITSPASVLGLQGAQLQAQYIMPAFIQNYQAGLAKGLTGQDLATYTIGATERPCGWTGPAAQWGNVGCPQGASSYLNYVSAWSAVTSMPGANAVPIPGVTTSPAESTPGSAIVTGPTVQGGTTDTPGQVQIPETSQLQIPTQTGIAGQIQVGIQDAFSNLFKGATSGLFAPFVLIIGSIIAIFVGAIIWNGDNVKKYAPDAAVAVAAA